MKILLALVLGILLNGAALADAPFNLAGRISIRQQETAYHGTLNWQHSDSSDELILLGPLGQGAAELRRDATGAVLQLPNGERQQAESLEALAGRFFGAALPIAALPNWIRGIAPDARLDEMQRPQRLVQQGWTVEWLRYGEDGRPQLLSIESAEVGVRLRIDSWSEGVQDKQNTKEKQ